MSRTILLDAGTLGLVTQRRGIPIADACRRWVAECMQHGARILVPEIADYEVRRELLRAGKSEGISRLDSFNAAERQRYIPISTAAMRKAAELWAAARRQGQPTAPNPALDCDVILAAQAVTSGVASSDLIVATANVGHLSRFVAAADWVQIAP